MENTQVVFDKDDYRYMKQAITQAKKAYKLNEVPIGCVIVYEGKVIGRGYNRRNTDKTSLGHAEITAIKKASRYMNDWRLEDCTLYVTLEPCQMCAGAIVQARIPRVVIGSMNPKAGCAGSILNILQIQHLITSARSLKVYVKKNVQKCSQHFLRSCVKARKKMPMPDYIS
ncbi:nucleoside deaminase [Eubacterium sp. AM46-8]|uniref:nucleoside deaminase n=1 Tax=Eubacterium sp. AM46-8 TaxID=2292350 RepID=UPI00267E9234